MTIEDVKTLFKKHYTESGLVVVDEGPTVLVFEKGTARWYVHEDDLLEYIELEKKFSAFEANPNDCSLCGLNYREQALRSIDIVPTAWLSGLGPKEMIFGDPESGNPYVTIGRASILYRAYFRFKPDFLKWSLSRLYNSGSARKAEMSLRERIFRPPVIRVEGFSATTVSEAVRITDELISGCLFQLAAVKGLPQQIRTKWAPTKNLAATGINSGGNDSFSLPLMRVNPIRDLVNLYTLGAGTHYAPLKFLTYYQVLEYFFLRISDEQLYTRLTRRISDLAFRYVPKDLDRLIQDVIDHKRENDETEMLKLVLSKFVDESELIQFIKDYEVKLGSAQYTKKRTVFGSDVQVTLTPGHVFGTVAKTVKVIRNALVHSSDRHERRERYVPFSANEDVISAELPLVRFLAEKVIVASASAIP